ncbi:hypothetical protein NPX13_g9741 [Xylaria arbuscula]|uniref:Uncharacterized protein n=1 Tax=Xylaria arbuscula TaxID=114810 RepID=A0A9W8THE9_9PEZI|nr:hypothetical protein NPX13_g9741 [Xylaria arbuscula]
MADEQAATGSAAAGMRREMQFGGRWPGKNPTDAKWDGPACSAACGSASAVGAVGECLPRPKPLAVHPACSCSAACGCCVTLRYGATTANMRRPALLSTGGREIRTVAEISYDTLPTRHSSPNLS